MFLLPSRKETVDDSEEDARDDRVCKLIFNNVKQKIKFMSCGSKKIQHFEVVALTKSGQTT